MSAPQDAARVGNLERNANGDYLEEIKAIRKYVVISGGWAWHFITPPGHIEFKHAHDHKDVDLFVAPNEVASLLALLKSRGYEKTWTRFDKLPGPQAFSRYVKSEFLN
jgi:hypothetical protein